jgi:hypothetical protein
MSEVKTEQKRKNKSPAKKSEEFVIESGDEEDKKSKKQKLEPTTKWELSGSKQVNINKYKGKTLIDIREFYTKDGELCPGKKGISLNMKDFEVLCEFMEEIKEAAKNA